MRILSLIRDMGGINHEINKIACNLNSSYWQMPLYLQEEYQTMNDNMVIGVCWYKEEQWERLKEIVADPEGIEDTYKQWKVDAEKTINELRNNGENVKKVSVDTEKMLLWANENNRPINGETRSEYAVYLLQQRKKK